MLYGALALALVGTEAILRRNRVAEDAGGAARVPPANRFAGRFSHPASPPRGESRGETGQAHLNPRPQVSGFADPVGPRIGADVLIHRGPQMLSTSGMAGACPLSPGERDILAAQVSYEAGRRLQMLADTYGLSPEQQALIFPVVARASPSYNPSLPIEGETLTDAYLRATEKTGDAVEPVDAASVADLATGADDPFEAALDASLESLESRLAPFLNSDQLAQMTAEQVDRYYWWGEVLLKIAGDAEDVNAAIAASLGAPAAASSAPREPAAADAAGAGSSDVAPPAAHQGGNLLDLLNGQP